MGDNLNRKIYNEKLYKNLDLSGSVLFARKHGPLLIGPEIYLKHCRAKFYETEQNLKAKKDEYRDKRVVMDQKWDGLAKEMEHFKENFCNFNQFVDDNDQKRKRAIELREHYTKTIENRENEIKKVTQKLETVKTVLLDLHQEIESHNIYEKYLNSVSDADSDKKFNNADTIVTQYEYYLEISKHLAEQQAIKFQDLQHQRQKLIKFKEEQTNHLLGLHTQIADLRERYENCSRKTHKIENLIRRIREITNKNLRNFTQTTDGMWNLYRQSCIRYNVKPKFARNDYENQLIYISNCLKRYRKVNHKFNVMMEKQKKIKKK